MLRRVDEELYLPEPPELEAGLVSSQQRAPGDELPLPPPPALGAAQPSRSLGAAPPQACRSHPQAGPRLELRPA